MHRTVTIGNNTVLYLKVTEYSPAAFTLSKVPNSSCLFNFKFSSQEKKSVTICGEESYLDLFW